jgi:hypothetical protein
MAVAWPALAVASFSWTSPLPFPLLLSMTDPTKVATCGIAYATALCLTAHEQNVIKL